MAIAKCKKGFRLDRKKNRCVRVRKKSKGNPSRNSKSYNPFKMWGSYVGAVIFMGITLISPTFLDAFNEFSFMIFGGFLMTPIIILLTGFLIGWGIHSLIRRLK